MPPSQRSFARLLSTLIALGGVMLVVSGLLSYTAPVIARADATPTSAATPAGTAPPSFAPLRLPGDFLAVGEAPSVLPSFTPSPSPSPSPTASPSPPPSPSPSPAPAAVPASRGRGIATRIVLPYSGIDLPVMSGEYDPPGNPGHYPLCDVAQYLTAFRQPWQEGTTYIYAHAQPGMFLPLLLASRRNNGSELIGRAVHVYTSDNRLFVYRIFAVKRHVLDFVIAYNVPAGEHRLVMQTSEGNGGKFPKLQVAARLVEVLAASPAAAHPRPRPRICG